MECRYCKYLEDQDFGDFILKTDHWIIFLAPNQSQLGTCVVALNRHLEDLSSLEKEEWDDFAQIVKKLEYALKSAFNATMFNWGCLMNASYLQDTPEPHLHWHFIPRYNHKVKFEDLTFEDPFFGYMRPRPAKTLSDQTKKKIIAKIRDNF